MESALLWCGASLQLWGLRWEKDSVKVTEVGSKGKADERQKQRKEDTKEHADAAPPQYSNMAAWAGVWDVTSFGLVAHWDGIAGNPSRVGFFAIASHVSHRLANVHKASQLGSVWDRDAHL